ncbi:uncharacterized protein ACBR49_017776 isoform 2-T2 [Aulostomus maculatus]
MFPVAKMSDSGRRPTSSAGGSPTQSDDPTDKEGVNDQTEGEGHHKDSEGHHKDSEGHHKDGEGRLTESEGRLTESEGRLTESEGHLTESEGHHKDGEGHHTESEGHHTESEGHHTESEGHHMESEGHHKDSEGHHTESEGHHTESEGHHTESEGHHKESEGHHKDGKGHHKDGEGHHTESEGHHTESEGHHKDGEGHHKDGEGHHTESEGHHTESEGHHKDGEGHHTESEGHHTESEGHHKDGEGHHKDGEGHHTESEGHHTESEGHHKDGEGHHKDGEGHHTESEGHHTESEGHHKDGEGHQKEGEADHSESDFPSAFLSPTPDDEEDVALDFDLDAMETPSDSESLRFPTYDLDLEDDLLRLGVASRRSRAFDPGLGSCSGPDQTGLGAVDHEDTVDSQGTRWRCFSTGDLLKETRVNMSVVEPFLRVLSHGGYYGDGMNDIIVFSSCYLPENHLENYQYVMDNLFRYVVGTLELMVAENYVIIYLCAGGQKDKLPGIGWLRECYTTIAWRLRKNLKGLYLVHPTWTIKALVTIIKPFISSKFSRKLQFVDTLQNLSHFIPTEHVQIPDCVRQYDQNLSG